jgi:hypothetical protein
LNGEECYGKIFFFEGKNIGIRAKIAQNQNNNKFIKNWSLSNFNELPLIQRITIINQVNRIIKAFRHYLERQLVRKIISLI